MMKRPFLVRLSLLALAGTADPVVAGEVPGALVVLEAPPGTPGSVESGAPARFVLTKDGQVFVGGTSRIETVRLDRAGLAALRKRIDAARKAAAVQGPAVTGDSTKAVRLRLPEDGPTDLTIDLERADPGLGPVVTFIRDLERYHDPGLVPFQPASYAVQAREGRLAGGCRRWTFSFPIDEAIAGPVSVAGVETATWPTGAWPASVCAGDRRYVVTLRPLLPGERP